MSTRSRSAGMPRLLCGSGLCVAPAPTTRSLARLDGVVSEEGAREGELLLGKVGDWMTECQNRAATLAPRDGGVSQVFLVEERHKGLMDGWRGRWCRGLRAILRDELPALIGRLGFLQQLLGGEGIQFTRVGWLCRDTSLADMVGVGTLVLKFGSFFCESLVAFELPPLLFLLPPFEFVDKSLCLADKQ